jgi:predicted peptidase
VKPNRRIPALKIQAYFFFKIHNSEMSQKIQIRHITTWTLPYLLSVPSGSPPTSGWPTICFLHGYGEAADRLPIDDALTRHGPLKSCNPKRVIDDFIIIAPQLPIAGDNWHKFPEVVKHIVSSVRKEFNGDSHRTYLTGFSYGGNGVIDLASTQQNFWAAYWPVDPPKVAPKDLGKPVWLSVGSAARRGTAEQIRKLNLEEPKIKFLDQYGVYLDEGLDHVGSAKSAYSDPRIYEWLLTKRLDKPEN